MEWSPTVPYNGLPDLPPAVDLETTRVLRAVTSARVEVAKLDQATRLMTDPHVLLNTIPLLEAQASSGIENIVTTADDLFRQAQLDEVHADPAVKETLRYRSALWSGVTAMRERGLTSLAAIRVCTEIKGRTMDVRSLPGTRIANPATREILYSPPEGAEVIRDRLANWESFIHTHDDLDPVVRMAVAHYQFEAIHPFSDGNGRTGRVLNILMLVDAGLLREPILYLSRPIIDSKDDYYRFLLEVTSHQRWEQWILYMLDAVRAAAAATTEKIMAIAETREAFAARYHGVTPGMSNAGFLGVLFGQPYCRIQQVMRACSVSRPTATAWLSALVDAGALETTKSGRDRLFLNTSFLETLSQPGA